MHISQIQMFMQRNIQQQFYMYYVTLQGKRCKLAWCIAQYIFFAARYLDSLLQTSHSRRFELLLHNPNLAS